MASGMQANIPLGVGNEVDISIEDINVIKEIQANHGVWNDAMKECQKGPCKLLQHDGVNAVVQASSGSTQQLHSKLLSKDNKPANSVMPTAVRNADRTNLSSDIYDDESLSTFSVGDNVEVIDDTKRLIALQGGHGEWIELIKKKGTVKFIHPDGDLQVEIGDSEIRLKPECVVKVKSGKGSPNLTEMMSLNLDDKMSRDTPLHVAVQNKNCDACRQLIIHGADVNALNKKDMTPIMLAAQIGCGDVLSLLVQQTGAMLDIGDVHNDTALHLAVQNSNDDAVRILLEADANIKAINNKQFTPFHLAAQCGHEKILKLCLGKYGESLVDLQKDDGCTALHVAAMNNHIACLWVLIGHKADLNITNTMKQTALHLAVSLKYLDCVKVLVRCKAKLDLQDEDEDTPLHNAIHLYNIQKRKNLLDELEDIMFNLAVRRGSDEPEDIVIYLVENGASLKIRNSAGKSPLTACEDPVLREKLRKLQAKASIPLKVGDQVVISIEDIDAIQEIQANHGGWNEAMKECLVGPCKLIKLTGVEAMVQAPSGSKHRLHSGLLSKYNKHEKSLSRYSVGDIVEVIDDKNRLKLFRKDQGEWKQLFKKQGTVKLIHPNGDLEVETEDTEIRLNPKCVVKVWSDIDDSLFTEMSLRFDDETSTDTPLHVAVQNKNCEECKQIIAGGVNVNALNKKNMTPIMLAAQIGCDDILSLLTQQQGAMLNIPDVHHNTALHLAVQNSNDDAVRILLEADANIKAINKKEFTPFHLAAQCGHEKILELCLDKHGESLVNLQKDDGCTALHVASINNHAACLSLLIRHKADLNMTNTIKQTALHIAVSLKNMDCVKVLVENKAKLDLQDEDGDTPLHNAIHLYNMEKKMGPLSGFKDIIKFIMGSLSGSDKLEDIAIYLVEQGASVDILNSASETPLTACEDPVLREMLRNLQANVKQTAANIPLKVGDEVVISIGDIDVIKEKQANHGGWDDAIEECLVGPCKLIHLIGIDAVVKAPSGSTHQLHSGLLSKYNKPSDSILPTAVGNADKKSSSSTIWDEESVLTFSLGDIVEVIDDIKRLKSPQGGHVERIALIKKKGTVKFVFPDGDLQVEIGGTEIRLNPECVVKVKLEKDDSNFSEMSLNLDDKTSGDTALHVAVQYKDCDTCRQLIADGADVNALNKKGMTPLMLAAQIGCGDVLSLLVQHPDARLDIGDVHNDTALHLAVQNSNDDAVRILLEAGANIKAFNNKQFTPFHLAAQCGHERILEFCLDKYDGSLVKLKDKCIALQLAAMNHRTACLRLLIRHKAVLNTRNYKMQTALHIAVSQKYMDCVEILVESKAELNLPDKKGNTPLHVAIDLHNMDKIMAKHVEFENMFKMDIHRRSDKPEDIATYLVEHGASLDIPNFAGESPLTACVDPVLREMLRNLQFNVTQAAGNIPLKVGDEVVISIEDIDVIKGMQANHGGWDDAMKEYLVRPCKLVHLIGVDAVVKVPSGGTHQLHSGLLSKYNKPAKSILPTAVGNVGKKSSSCDIYDEETQSRYSVGDIVKVINDKNREKVLQEGDGGWHELMTLILKKKGTVKLIHPNGDLQVEIKGTEIRLNPECVVKVKSDIDDSSFTEMTPLTLDDETISHSGDTPLHVAVRKHDFSLFSQLIADGADVNAQNKKGMTPMMLAAEIGCGLEVSLLLDQPNARPNIRNKDNNTALHLAVDSSNNDAVELLLIEGADIKAINNKQFTPFHLAAHHGDEKILELFLDIKGESLVNLQQDDKWTALHLAARNNRTDCLRLLIRHKADLNIRNNKMQTALHIAVSQRYMGCTKILVECEAELDLQDENGDTPLHYAIQKKKMHRMQDIAIYLVENGASLKILNSAGKSPLTLCEDTVLREKLRKLQAEGGFCRIPEFESGFMAAGPVAIQNRLYVIFCEICRENQVNIIFNCGHRACNDCANNDDNCPICHQEIVT